MIRIRIDEENLGEDLISTVYRNLDFKAWLNYDFDFG